MLLQASKTPHALRMLTGLVEYLQRLGMKVVCEGVETLQHIEIANRLGCDYQQATPTPCPPPLAGPELPLAADSRRGRSPKLHDAVRAVQSRTRLSGACCCSPDMPLSGRAERVSTPVQLNPYGAIRWRRPDLQSDTKSPPCLNQNCSPRRFPQEHALRLAYGADAVYAGQPRYSLRVRNNEFDHENLQLGINEAHALGKQFYVVANIQPHNSKLKTFIRDMRPVVEMKPDALIMSDPVSS